MVFCSRLCPALAFQKAAMVCTIAGKRLAILKRCPAPILRKDSLDPDPIISEKRQKAQELICYAYLVTERLPPEDVFRRTPMRPLE